MSAFAARRVGLSMWENSRSLASAEENDNIQQSAKSKTVPVRGKENTKVFPREACPRDGSFYRSLAPAGSWVGISITLPNLVTTCHAIHVPPTGA